MQRNKNGVKDLGIWIFGISKGPQLSYGDRGAPSVQNISANPSLEPRVPRIATAYALMMSGMAAEIVLIDRDSRRAEGHVSDLRDADVFSHTTRIVVGDFSDCCSADVTIMESLPNVKNRTLTARLPHINPRE